MKTAPRAIISAAALAITLVVAGCSAGDDQGQAQGAPVSSDRTTAEAVLSQYGLDGMSGRQVVDALEAMPLDERPADLIASVQPDELLLRSADAESTLPLPTDSFYLSVAPYVDQTHPCAMHSLTTCTGELGGRDVAVEVVDDATGETLIDETRTAADNGFIGLWLPRDVSATLTVQYDGKSASAPITTGADAETCLTTMQLT